jgi:hypothetical protein
MGDAIHGLREDLTRFRTLLTDGGLCSFSSGERRQLSEDALKLLGKLDEVAEAFLTVGLLGGTGVGKSSIMNGLAGVEISSASHRRPHTDQAVIYRHNTAVFPAAIQRTKFPWREITHDVDPVRQILLCDLPDFDSFEGEHRELVLGFLENLDVLVWVTSPEKYGDGRFYSLLREVPKARRNFFFVLNKVDLLFQERTLETGFDQLARLTGSFRQHLVENGVPHPVIYALSAQETLSSTTASAPWNQFASFRHQIFQHRDAKEVAVIKSANLDVEVRQFLMVLEKEAADLEILQGTLHDFVAELEEERAEAGRAGREAIAYWLETRFDKDALLGLTDPGLLVGPGYVLALLIQELRKWSRPEKEEAVVAGLFGEKGPPIPLERHLTRLEDRLAHRLLQKGLPPSFSQYMEGVLNAKEEWDGFRERLQQYLGIRIESREAPSSRSFRCLQVVTYLVLLAFLLTAVSEAGGWETFFNHPSWRSLAWLILSIIRNLFSPTGLAALGSFLLINTFLGFRFYARYKKLLQRRAQKFIESLKLESGEIWEEKLDSIHARLMEREKEIMSRMSVISGLKKLPREGS